MKITGNGLFLTRLNEEDGNLNIFVIFVTMKYPDYHDIRLPFLKSNGKNLYDRFTPGGAPFRIVGPASPLIWRRATEKLAYFFHREMQFDFPPYEASEVTNWDLAKDRVIVLVKETTLTDWEQYLFFIGAVGIRWRVCDNAPACWAITWVWLHPYERRQGHLTRVWPFIMETFPSARIEPPISQAMVAFLRKVGYKEPEPRFLDGLLGIPVTGTQ